MVVNMFPFLTLVVIVIATTAAVAYLTLSSHYLFFSIPFFYLSSPSFPFLLLPFLLLSIS